MFNILAFGEILIRIPIDLEGFERKKAIYWGGAEANVLCALSRLNNNTRLISKVPDNKMGNLAIENLNKYKVDTLHIAKGGDRIGLYYYSAPQNYIQGEVVYDRKHSSIHTLTTTEINKEKLFSGVEVFYVSGISLALVGCREVVEDLWNYAKSHNIKLVFDVNYRSRLWSIEEAKPFLAKYMAESDILFANDFDCKNFLGMSGEKTEDLYKAVLSKYNISHMATLHRRRISYNEYEVSGILCSAQNFSMTPIYKTTILERIGGGDCFVAGILNGIFNAEQNIADNAIKLVLMKYSMSGDVFAGFLEDYKAALSATSDVRR
ncbi:MAG: sugar kinase [Alphaproteobacteria bacterium]|jgi:2-dehydro-3-deoxygluconokinase|nr:sugar kinase [Alphaproteobacteria bacterium]